VAVATSGPSLQTGASATNPCPVRTGTYGITWNFMGVNGPLREFPKSPWKWAAGTPGLAKPLERHAETRTAPGKRPAPLPQIRADGCSYWTRL